MPDTVSRVDEVVQLFDERGRPAGTAPRSRVRAENLCHGATGVVVRDGLGRIYVHRRTETKDVYPGLHDCCAGGVMLAGEDPGESARREIAEELGVTGAVLRRIGVSRFADEHTNYVAFQYEARYDGPIRWQPEEVAWGAWMTLDELTDRLADPGWPFVPDSRALIGPWVAERAADRVRVDDGWDSAVSVVEGRWIDRTPRRADVLDRLLAETRLMPRLAPELPLDVPLAARIGDDPAVFRHPIVEGDPVSDAPTRSNGVRLGEFLRTLHDLDPAIADGTGIPDPQQAAGELGRTLARFRSGVLPRVPDELRAPAIELLARAGGPHTRIVHGDLGPAHVRCTGGAVSGVIDWTDAHVGDPAVDLAWALYGGGEAFADGVAQAYAPSAAERARALDWHRLGPWHEVTYGVDTGRDELVASGMRGVVDRLRL